MLAALEVKDFNSLVFLSSKEEPVSVDISRKMIESSFYAGQRYGSLQR